MKRLIREPLVHFFLLAAIIFAAYGLFAGSGQPTDDRIDVTQAKQLFETARSGTRNAC